MSWTDARDTRLKELCADRISAAAVAKRLNEEFPDHAPISRNAVIGRARRKGVQLRGVSTPPPPCRQTKNDPGANVVFDLREARKIGNGKRSVAKSRDAIDLPAWPFRGSLSIVPNAPKRSCGKVTVAQLNSFTCRWPIGDLQSPEFYFCGAEPVAGRPYCDAHCRLAYHAI